MKMRVSITGRSLIFCLPRLLLPVTEKDEVLPTVPPKSTGISAAHYKEAMHILSPGLTE